MLSQRLSLRRLTIRDAAQAAILTQQIGWSQDVAAWDRLIRWGGGGSFCLISGEKIIATTLALIYDERLAWIGAVITHPDFRGQGIARQLVATAMDYVKSRHVRCVMLDASDMGHRLYKQFGFRDLYRVETWGVESISETGDERGREMRKDDLADVIALDASVFGLDRPSIISDLANSGLCWVDDSSGKIDGYIVAQSGNTGWRLGPWYHQTSEGAAKLFRTAVAHPSIRPVRVQAPATNPHVKVILESYGFQQMRFTTRMVWGAEPPGDMARQYGVATLASG